LFCGIITKRRQTLHNILSRTKIVDLTTATIYKSIEEEISITLAEDSNQ
jgi:hypothetical protein